MKVAEFEAWGIELLLAGRDSLRFRCSRPVTAEKKSLIVGYKRSLLRELRAERRRQSKIKLAQGSEGECEVCKVRIERG